LSDIPIDKTVEKIEGKAHLRSKSL
jgi:hypothetical protein